jgi:hypothetical protein
MTPGRFLKVMIQNRFDSMLRTGLIFLLLSSLWRWFVHPSAILPENAVDAIQGLLLGISIMSMLIGLVRGRKSQCSPDNV